MVRKINLIASCLIILAVFACGASVAQQPAAATDLWRVAPANSLLITGFDGRPDSPSMKAFANAETPEAREALAKQQESLRKAMEDFALLFGISLDFAKDLESWCDQQWAFVVVPGDKIDPQPVFAMASKDAAAAGAALQKMLEPWQRLGELTQSPDSEFPITVFKHGKAFEVYASASGPVVAVSPSATALKQVLKGGGFAAGSPGDKAFKALSGSMFYAYMDPALLQMMKLKADIPMAAFGLGVSAVDTGVKVRVIGLPSEPMAEMLKKMLPPQTGALAVNASVPSTSLIAAALPDLSSFAKMAGMMFGNKKNPVLDMFQQIGDTQISGAMTAALPIPAGFVSAAASSDQAATDKMAAILDGLKGAKIATRPATTICGVSATPISIPRGPTMYLAQVGQNLILASDSQSFASAAAAAKGEKPGLAQSDVYKETMAGLDKSNIVTAYVNLAPVQGFGHLANGLGIGNWPFYGSAAKALVNMQALGVGLGFDGEVVDATLFVRAKPQMGPTIGPAAIAGTAIAAAVAFPAFVRAREAARSAACVANLKELALAAETYAVDHDGKLPSSANWQAELAPYVKHPISELVCPVGEAVYAYNKNLGGVIQDKIYYENDVIMFFEAQPGLPNRTGSRANAKLPHNGCGFFAYADTHIERLSEVPPQSSWVPHFAKPVIKKAPVKPRKK